MMAILSNTPPWVFGLFGLLLAVGLLQTRTRPVHRLPALLLPIGMAALSLAGIQSSFGLRPVPLVSWGLGLAASACVGLALWPGTGASYDRQTRSFRVPGSEWPLGVIMAIFFAKYGYAVMRALQVGPITEPLFIAALSGVYGLLSGYFAARAIALARLMRWL